MRGAREPAGRRDWRGIEGSRLSGRVPRLQRFLREPRDPAWLGWAKLGVQGRRGNWFPGAWLARSLARSRRPAGPLGVSGAFAPNFGKAGAAAESWGERLPNLVHGLCRRQAHQFAAQRPESNFSGSSVHPAERASGVGGHAGLEAGKAPYWGASRRPQTDSFPQLGGGGARGRVDPEKVTWPGALQAPPLLLHSRTFHSSIPRPDPASQGAWTRTGPKAE